MFIFFCKISHGKYEIYQYVLNGYKRNAKNADYEFLLDEELYKERFAVERTNAWIDAFKSLLVRFETTTRNWMSLHYIAFSIILLRKIHPEHF